MMQSQDAGPSRRACIPSPDRHSCLQPKMQLPNLASLHLALQAFDANDTTDANGRRLTWQNGEQYDNDDVEDQNVCQAHPNGQPTPPVVGGHANAVQDAVPQSLASGPIGVQFVLPVICTPRLAQSEH